MGLNNRMLVSGDEECPNTIDYDKVHALIDVVRKDSIAFLRNELTVLSK